MKTNPSKYIHQISEKLRSEKGRDFLTFLIFLVISAFFWLLLTLNEDVQQDYSIPLEISDIPANTTLLTGENATVNVTVQDKGSAFSKFNFGVSPRLKIRFNEFQHLNDSILLLTPLQLNQAVRNLFGISTTILSMRPDSLRFLYTRLPGVKTKLVIDGKFETQPQFALSGTPKLSADSVMIYSTSRRRARQAVIRTEPISVSNLSDTTVVTARVMVEPGMKAVPSLVKITIPVEPLVGREIEIPVTPLHVPAGLRLVTFPANVKLFYLLPKSTYSNDNISTTIRATVDYRETAGNPNSIPVKLSNVPSDYRSVSVNPGNVEYMIEHLE